MNGMQTPIDIQITIQTKGDLRSGWLLINGGLLLLMWGVSWLFWGLYSYFDPPAEFTWVKMMLPANLFGLSGILFGFLALIFGIRAIRSSLGSAGVQLEGVQEEQTKFRSSGWMLAITGGLFTFWGILFAVLTIYNLVILRGTPDATTDIAEQVGCFLPGLIIGLPLLLSGSRMVIFGERGGIPAQNTPGNI